MLVIIQKVKHSTYFLSYMVVKITKDGITTTWIFGTETFWSFVQNRKKLL